MVRRIVVKIFFEIIWAFIEWLKYPIIICISIIAIFFILIYINIGLGILKGKRFKKGSYHKVKEHSIFRRLFIDLPYRISEDMFNKDPDVFRYQGVIIFEGRQGRGKTIAMCQLARKMQQEYPFSKCLSNLNYKNQDNELDDWKKLVNYKNGKHGVIAMIDETQNWFSSNQSKDFPPEMLEVITQNRKNRRIILRNCSKFLFTRKGYSFTSYRSASLYDAIRCFDDSSSS